MLGSFATPIRASGIPIAQIDHHYPSPSMEGVAAIRLLDEEAPSTTEMVYSLFKRGERALTIIAALMRAVAILMCYALAAFGAVLLGGE